MKTVAILVLCAVSAYTFPEARIVNGNVAKLGQFPYQAAISIIGDDGLRKFKCGGTLVTKRNILTAAHCFKEGQSGTIWLGSTKYGKGQSFEFSAKDVKIHEDFNEQTYLNDVAIITIPETQGDVHIDGKYVAVAKLDYRDADVNEELTVSGFGWISNSEDTDTLHYLQMRILDGKACNLTGDWDEMIFCTEGVEEGQSTCHGDSGGPAVVETEEGPVVRGIVLGGFGGCEASTYKTYNKNAITKVNKKKEHWIVKHLCCH